MKSGRRFLSGRLVRQSLGDGGSRVKADPHWRQSVGVETDAHQPKDHGSDIFRGDFFGFDAHELAQL